MCVCLGPAIMDLPREHHNGLTTNFLLTIKFNWNTYFVYTTTQCHGNHSNTAQNLRYFGNDNKQRGARVSKNANFSTFSPPTILGCCMITMDSPMLPTRDGDTRESTSLSVELPLSDNVSGNLTDIIKIGKGSGTFNKCSERFSSATIKNRSLASH